MSSEHKNLRYVHVLHELFVNFAEEFDVSLTPRRFELLSFIQF